MSGLAALAQERVRVGVLAYLGAEHSVEEWAPTLQALKRAMPQAQVSLESFDHAGLALQLAAGSLDFVITNPGHYVELEMKFGISRIATREPGIPVASSIITRAARNDITSMADLRGRTVAIVGEKAFGGFQVAWRELSEAGIDPYRDFRLLSLGLPMDRVIEAVQSGAADAGIIRACLVEQLGNAGEGLKVLAPRLLAETKCIVSSRAYPHWPFSKARTTSPELAKRVATTLLTATQAPGEAGWTVPVDYQPVRELFRALKIGPYENLRHESLADLLRRYWPFVALAALAFAAWLIHVVRVEALVRRRTGELAQANAVLKQEMAARREAEERDLLHQRELDHAGRLSVLGEMACGLAHEINQPLTAITNYADGCALRLAGESVDLNELREATRRINEQAGRASAVIRQMRAFARKRKPDRVVLDLNGVVAETAGFFEGPVRRAGGRIRLELGEGLSPALADRIQIQQVLLNLLQNALDAERALDDGVSEIVVTTTVMDDGLAIRVADHGTGLSEEARKRLFEPFFTTKPQGLGLGLALCRSILEEHGGRLTATDNPGGGTVMTLWLPAQERIG